MSNNLITEINETTGFLNGNKWESADEVREYFRVFRTFYGDQLRSDEMPSQAQLDSWAEIAVRYLFQSHEVTS